MADKPMSLEDLAHAEQIANEKREAKKKAYRDGQRRLLTLTPEQFFQIAGRIKQGVTRFNGAARIENPIQYQESAAVTTRDVRAGADHVVELKRLTNRLVLVMRPLWRMRNEDAWIIEIEGELGVPPTVDRVAIRIQGVFAAEELRWRITAEGTPIETPIEEVADRMVAATATGELTRLWANAPFVRGVRH